MRYMTPSVKFTVPGPPVPKARTRSGRWGHFTPPKTVEYENSVRQCAKKAVRTEGWKIGEDDKYRLCVYVYRKYHRGDLDNYVKSASDALNGVVWKDDRNVWELRCYMRTCRANPRTIVRVDVLSSDEIDSLEPYWT